MPKCIRNTRYWGLVAVSAILACSQVDGITAPGVPGATSSRDRITAEGYPQITDDEGTTYTLQTDKLKLVISTGGEIDLTPEQAANYTNAFYAIIDDAPDIIAQTLAGTTSQCTGTGTDYCAASRVGNWTARSNDRVALSVPSPRGSGAPSTLHHRGIQTTISLEDAKRLAGTHTNMTLWKVRHPTSGDHRRPMRPASGGPISSALGSSTLRASVGLHDIIGASDPEFSCYAITKTISDLVVPWRDLRHNFEEALKEDRPKWNWTEMKFEPPTLAEQVAVDEAGYDLMTSTNTLNVLAYWYTSLGCMQNLWPDYSTNPSPTMDYVFRCSTEEWEISFDGGYTWQPIEVAVCEYNVI